MPRVALLVNPIAGMGGPAGLKGSDDREAVEAAGVEPVAPERARRFLEAVRAQGLAVDWVTCPGSMGADALAEAGLDADVVGKVAEPTTAEDTRRLAPLVCEGADALVVVGGDGTAADLVAAGVEVPVVGVPAGVKMHSGVYAQSPEAAAALLEALLRGDAPVEEVEVRDVGEEAFRDGEIALETEGTLRAPSHRLRVPGKSHDRSDADDRRALAQALVEPVGEGTWIVGPGSTTLAVKEALGVDGTPLGVDIIQDGDLVVADADAADCEAHAGPGTSILVTPIGGQGVVFGRGNQPITPEVLRACGVDAVRVIATPGKVRGLEGLRFDTGDPELDRAFGDHVRVTTGSGRSAVVRVLT